MFRPRNLTFFRMSPAVVDNVGARLRGAMFDNMLRAPGPLELFTRGFVSVYRGAVEPTLSIPSAIYFRFGTQDKLLPASAVNAKVADKVAKIAAEEGRKVGGRERKRIKEDVLNEMLPHAPIRTLHTDCLIDRESGTLVIDTASRKRAELVLTQIREALGSFPAVPLAPGESPRVLLTDWLANKGWPQVAIEGAALGDECELRDPATSKGAVARFTRQDLDAEEVQENLRQGKQVYRLGMDFDHRLSFVLGEDLVVRKFKLLDVVLDDLPEDGTAEQDLYLVTLELQRLTAMLFEWFNCPRPADA